MSSKENFSNVIRMFDTVGMEDIAIVGGKNASLGEMCRQLRPQGIRIPEGFVITADAYTALIDHAKAQEDLTRLMSGLNKEDMNDLSTRAREARATIKRKGLPTELSNQIREAYRKLETICGANIDVAVRSSATAEDLPDASFAGQQETFLNVRGADALLEACLNCFASLFTERAIAYRIDKGFDHEAIRLSIGVQKMVRSDLASSGVIFTLDPESGFRNVVLVTSSWGLGENIVGGRVDPDEFLVFKPKEGIKNFPVLRRKIGSKQQRLIYDSHGTRTTKNIPVSADQQCVASITDAEVVELAKWACLIEDYYSKRIGQDVPMDIEWAKDGHDGLLYIVQARPETVCSRQNRSRIEIWTLKQPGKELVKGRSIGERIGTGQVRVINDVSMLNTFQEGEVLVAEMTDPDWEPVMKKAAAIITNRGGRTCHAAIISRELGVPCVVGTREATQVLRNGQAVTVSCAEGSTGKVYENQLPFEKKTMDLEKLPQTKTDILVNVGNPEHAFSVAALPTNGVGLAREEFIIANDVKVHPLALCRYSRISDQALKQDIDKMARGFESPEEFFVSKLSEGVATIAAAFYPRPVIVRLSDFKTNEYAHLLGGKLFEPQEENPMIGFRGASRYLHESYKDAFALECKALYRARSTMGFTNIKLMIPFCRTPEEGRAVLQSMAASGLKRGEDGLEVYVMCEVPSNVFLIDEFAQVFDGFSIGSNDLTQLVLGVDRDSEILGPLFDERNPAVLRAIAVAIAGAKKAGRKIGICGQAPSDFPEVVQFLISQGIDSISLNEDAVLKTIMLVSQAEQNKTASDREYTGIQTFHNLLKSV